MKKILSLVLIFAFCFAMCFAFVGCDTEFRGNFKTVATAEEIQEVVEEVKDAEIAMTGIPGLKMEAKMESTAGNETSISEVNMKVNFEKKQLSMVMSSTVKEGDETENAKMAAYIYEDNFYCDMQSSVLTMQYKQSLELLGGFDSYFDEQLSGGDSAIDMEEYLGILTEVSQMTGAKVYIDKSNGIKIKIEFDDAKNPDDDSTVMNGTAIFVFNDDCNLTALKFDVDGKIDDETMKAYIKITSFSGSIKLPSGAQDWSSPTFPF